MEFDLRTCDAAYYFVLDFMGMTSDEFFSEKIINCENSFELFWDRNIERIKSVNISELKIMAFHITGSIDGCKGIKANGLMDLQKVLSEDTALKRVLAESDIEFDIPNKRLFHKGKSYDIDYEKYKYRHLLSEIDEALDGVAHRVFYDYCVNGFFLNDDVKKYGTDIHERPEFLMRLCDLFPEAKIVEEQWVKRAKSYRIDFYVTVNQVHRFNFELDDYSDPPYKDWLDLDDDLKIKKWMLSHAIDRAFDNLEMMCLYIKDSVVVPANQIVSVSEL